MMIGLLVSLFALVAPVHAKAVPLGPDYAANCQSPRWSSDGAQLSYEVNFHDKKRIELYVLTPGGGTPRGVTPSNRGASSISSGFQSEGDKTVVHELSWAPSSIGRFTYSASNAEHDYDLFIDGTGAIAHSPNPDGGPAWSPDGRFIAFTSSRTGQGDIYLVDTFAVEDMPRRVTDFPTSSELYVTWSPDSKFIAFVAHNDEGDSIYLVDPLSGLKPVAITSWGRTQTRPTFSPDGKFLAFYSNHEDSSRFDLYVIQLGESAKLIDQNVVMNANGPTWTPEGTHLVYVRNDDSRFDPVYVAPIAAPDRARMVPTYTVGNGDLDVARGTDGRSYVVVAAQGVAGDRQRDFRRLYFMELNNLP